MTIRVKWLAQGGHVLCGYYAEAAERKCPPSTPRSCGHELRLSVSVAVPRRDSRVTQSRRHFKIAITWLLSPPQLSRLWQQRRCSCDRQRYLCTHHVSGHAGVHVTCCHMSHVTVRSWYSVSVHGNIPTKQRVWGPDMRARSNDHKWWRRNGDLFKWL